jgi:hypothetical protein
MKKQLQKAIDLAAYTGDKLIVVDEKTDKGMVVMSLEDYEKLLFIESDENDEFIDLTEDELLDKINREITFNKSADEIDDEIDDAASLEGDFLDSKNNEKEIEDLLDQTEEKEEEATEENLYYYEEAPVIVPPIIQQEPAVKEESIVEEVEDVVKEDVVEEIAKEEPKVADSFTSVGEELKNRNHWEIPKSIKNSAAEIK